MYTTGVKGHCNYFSFASLQSFTAMLAPLDSLSSSAARADTIKYRNHCPGDLGPAKAICAGALASTPGHATPRRSVWSAERRRAERLGLLMLPRWKVIVWTETTKRFD